MSCSVKCFSQPGNQKSSSFVRLQNIQLIDMLVTLERMKHMHTCTHALMHTHTWKVLKMTLGSGKKKKQEKHSYHKIKEI